MPISQLAVSQLIISLVTSWDARIGTPGCPVLMGSCGYPERSAIANWHKQSSFYFYCGGYSRFAENRTNYL